jgi:hypothetical protein
LMNEAGNHLDRDFTHAMAVLPHAGGAAIE